MRTLILRPLSKTKATDISELTKALSSTPTFKLPGPDKNASFGEVASWMFSKIPSNSSPDDKFVFGIYFENDPEVVGAVDVVRNWPEKGIAFLGLLLLSEPNQGRSIGVVALRNIEWLATAWGCNRLHIAVDSAEPRRLAFWSRQGFRELYRKQVGGFAGDAIAMEKVLSVSGNALPLQGPIGAVQG